MVFHTSDGHPAFARVLSDPIHGRDLKLHHISHKSVHVQGGSVIILTSKVKRRTVRLKITDMQPHSWRNGSLQSMQRTLESRGWCLDEEERPTVYIAELHVHYQYGLVVTMPPFWDQNIVVPRTVEIQLVDDDQRSAALTMEYCPSVAARGQHNVAHQHHHAPQQPYQQSQQQHHQHGQHGSGMQHLSVMHGTHRYVIGMQNALS